ncbi:MAG: hypothetical protein H6719_33690 [Sandaracinaceae bacterium]|nr:hypothetical protein [Sandaracinaceae bacterium]
MRHAFTLLAVLAVAAPVSAQVTLPNGMVVPVDSMNGEIQLDAFFASRGEPIDWISDARNVPDTFSPLCDFTAALLLHEAGASLGVGWYNVVPGATAAPTASEIYQIVPPGAAVGTTITGATIRGDARYLGGDIGFALIRTPPHFTESRWNTVCNAGPCASSPGPWILSLSYLSPTMADAFYVAFEDGDTSSSAWNNDGDYNDFVFLFTGITCAGAGEPCTVPGAEGICANGLTECAAAGALTCRQVNPPGEEACDGADNDCDGAIDEGDGLCGAMEVCSRGRCVGRCQVEFGCADPADVCEDGLCIDAACAGLTCDAGLACEAGMCVSPCDGVVCPGDQVCRVGVCLDACVGVTCDAGQVCEGGVCVNACACRACGAGLECAGDGRCVDEGCGAVDCAAPTICRAGACVDPCTGAVCPRGQECTDGACVDVPTPDVDAGPPGGADAGAPGDDAGGAGMDGGRASSDAGPGGSLDSGCGCRATGSRRSGPLALLALGLAFILRRRRR